MKKLYFLFSVLLISSASFGQDMVITGVFDGPLTGGSPKVIELYVKNNIADLSDYGVGSANNGGGTDGEELTFSGSANAGDFIYVVSESTEGDFNTYFGLTANYISSVANINGDDAIELFYNSSVIDVFGDIAVDGTGEDWEYLDGWAYRNNSTGPDGSTFVLGNWSFSSPNATDDCTTNAGCSSTFPIGTYTDSGTPCGVTLGSATYTCNASTTGNSDSVTINIPYTGSDATITSVTSSTGTVGGDDPASVSDGTITITGLTEGDAWDITINGGNCDGSTKFGTVAEVECLPTACFDLTGTNEFEIVQIAANDDGDNWYLNSGAYTINGYCSGCTETETDSWLVFGPLDLSSAAGTELVFNSVEGFSGSDLGIFYTNAYGGCPDASITTWTSIQTIASGNDGYYSLSIPSTGTAVYIGIQYADSDTVSSWTLSDVGIYATSCPTLGTIVASDCSSLTAIDKEISNFEMYPNPTDLGYINISSRSSSAMSVKVFDLLGKQLINKTLSNNTLDVSNLNTGVYLLKVAQDNATITKRLVIK